MALADGFLMRDHVEAALGGQLLAAFGNQRRLVGLDLAGDVDDGVDRGHFQVEAVGHDLAQQADVAILDVAAVFAQVHGDAVGAAEKASTAAATGSGSCARRAWRTVATWSMLTPSRIISRNVPPRRFMLVEGETHASVELRG